MVDSFGDYSFLAELLSLDCEFPLTLPPPTYKCVTFMSGQLQTSWIYSEKNAFNEVQIKIVEYRVNCSGDNETKPREKLCTSIFRKLHFTFLLKPRPSDEVNSRFPYSSVQEQGQHCLMHHLNSVWYKILSNLFKGIFIYNWVRKFIFRECLWIMAPPIRIIKCLIKRTAAIGLKYQFPLPSISFSSCSLLNFVNF